ncbi:hypothetical protein LY76DRAFT_401245 [Colletotrichum caudatum]|nr:hypothetical protein LY76DRAFT_401245 [Colletotrichum caudatum]
MFKPSPHLTSNTSDRPHSIRARQGSFVLCCSVTGPLALTLPPKCFPAASRWPSLPFQMGKGNRSGQPAPMFRAKEKPISNPRASLGTMPSSRRHTRNAGAGQTRPRPLTISITRTTSGGGGRVGARPTRQKRRPPIHSFPPIKASFLDDPRRRRPNGRVSMGDSLVD